MSIMASILKVNGSIRHDQGMVHLEGLHTGMDRTVLVCCRWESIDLKRGFRSSERKQTQFRVSLEAKREILGGF